MKDLSWEIIDRYFAQGGGKENANPIVQMQIESYNEFIDKKLPQIIQGFNSIQICHNYKESVKDFAYKIFINIQNPSLSKPVFQQQDGSQILMTPHIARMNNPTYASNLYADVHILTETINADDIKEKNEVKVPNVNVGKIPIMVRSKACILNQIPGISENSDREECRYDPGGYFIVNGNEKVVISQDRISENKTLVFSANGCLTEGLTAEIRSAPDGVFLPPKTTSLILSAKPNHMGRTIRLNTSFIRSEIPLFIMFRALGVQTDQEILSHIVFNIGDEKQSRMLIELMATVDDASDIYTQEQALKFLMRYVSLSGTPKEYLEQPEQARKILLHVIENDFLPHVGKSLKRKALYLGFMVRKILKIYLGYQLPDNRDSYLHKRIDTPGVLLSNLFRQCWGKMIKEMRNSIQREIQQWRATPTIPANIINASNIHRFIKQSVVDMGIRYALSTGNWGVKTLGSFQNIRAGVAQVLNRMSYLSTLSHLRRINTPMEKNGKLVQPRKLENSQYGMICPAETPEGGSVGLVKNIALSTRVTTSSSSVYVRKCVEELGVKIFNDQVTNTMEYLNEMGEDKSVHIMINGDLIGYHQDPVAFYQTIKSLKRRGQISPMTGIVWDVPQNIITITTEAGRMCRPLYIVENKDLRLYHLMRANPDFWKDMSQRSFMDYVALLDTNEEGFIEYMDVDEIDKSMVAMTQDYLSKSAKMTYIPPKYTHCEIHPSLMLGVLACNIPFSDHNQSPRNCYQCLWEEEPVLMANGTKKAIKDVVIGDKVVTFNPVTKKTSTTTVVYQYVRPTDKPIVKVETKSGRRIVTTDDHKYMTTEGWLAPKDFKATTKVGILKSALYSEEYRVAESFTYEGELVFMSVKITPMPNCRIADITVESDHHCFFGGDHFAVHNSAMGKQAVGIYMSNFNQRIDTLAHVLNYPQKPLARTKLSKYTNSDSLPSGVNAVIAIMTKTGYNQEDSVMVNKSALDRGLFTSTYYKAYRDQCSKNHSTGEEEQFTKPTPTTSHVKPYNYDKLDETGFVQKNTFVDDGDILVGKVMPHKVQGQIFPRDASTVMKTNDSGNIDMTYQGVNSEGYKFTKIRLRSYRKPTVGDKLSSRHGQKGTIGMVYNQEDMPFTKDGIMPDIIVNPHAIPSRMTVGQLIECIMGKSCSMLGTLGDATPFTDCSVEKIADVLETYGLERYGNEIMYNGRTGEMIHTEIFIGPTFYQRLKHMVVDKQHCLTLDHEVLTEEGWKLFPNLTAEDKVATLQYGEIVYERPLQQHYYPDYKGKMYHIRNAEIDLDVTAEHRMWISTCRATHQTWSPYYLTKAENIVGKYVKYKKDAHWSAREWQFELPPHECAAAYPVHMYDWLVFFGIWITQGGVEAKTRMVCLSQCVREYVGDILAGALNKLGYSYEISGETILIKDDQLYNYLKDFDGSRLPDWVWKLSASQCKYLIYAMQLEGGYFAKDCEESEYYTPYQTMADDFMKLCIHAGWTGNMSLYIKEGTETIYNGDHVVVANNNVWKIKVDKDATTMNPEVNQPNHTPYQREQVYYYEGPVFCLSVSSEVFMVRRNGKAVWTGNSRGSNGPIVTLTRQPAEGRARNGGLRFGEMERDAIVAHGAGCFLKERMIDVSDNYRVFVCKKCGLFCVANPERNIFKCNSCKNQIDIVQARVPYSMKLLIQELMTMGIAPRMTV